MSVIVDLLPLVPFDTWTGRVADLETIVLTGRTPLMLVPSHPFLRDCQDHPHVIAAHKAYAEYRSALDDEILYGDGTDEIGGLSPTVK